MTAYGFVRQLSRSTMFAAMLTAVAATTSAQASVEISDAPTENMHCAAGVCAPTAKKAVLNANDLANMLGLSDVTVATGSGAVTITVSAPFSWTSTHRLTLSADFNVTVRSTIDVAGTGAVTIKSNNNGTGGEFLVFDEGRVRFWDLASQLNINGKDFVLVGDLDTLATDIALQPTGVFALANDYDSTHREVHIPIETEFDGLFEGLGQQISRLHLSAGCRYGKSLGLFATIGDQGRVRNLHLTDVRISSKQPNYAGALAGVNQGAIENVSVTGQAHMGAGNFRGCDPHGYLGGLVGLNAGTVKFATSSVRVSGADGTWLGGLVGAGGGTIDSSSASGSVTGGNGDCSVGLIGGLAGEASSIIRSFATGPVEAGMGTCAGGLVGASGNVTQSYAMGAIITSGCAGGLVGQASGNISQSYSTGRVFGNPKGGFVGCSQSTNASDYWDTEASGTGTGCGSGNCSDVTGETTAEMTSGLPLGFDRAVWHHHKGVNNGYPYLLANPPR